MQESLCWAQAADDSIYAKSAADRRQFALCKLNNDQLSLLGQLVLTVKAYFVGLLLLMMPTAPA